MPSISSWVAGAALVGTVALGGCGLWSDIFTPKGKPTNTAQFRVETEVVPNAVLVRQDTMPDSPNGRYAFKPGAARLLVVTRIGSFAAKDDDGRPLPGGAETAERVWITIPASTAAGTTVDVEKLLEKSLAGCDVREAGAQQFFIQTYAIKGNIRIVRENAGSVTMDVRITVAPSKWKGTDWEYKEVVEVPVTEAGIQAGG
jgi:hypothetical protein